MGKRLGEGNYLTHSHKPVHSGAGNGAQAPRGSISVFGEKGGVGGAHAMAKWICRGSEDGFASIVQFLQMGLDAHA